MHGLELILQARALLAQGRAEEARRCAEEALRLDARDADALHLLGAAHHRSGELAKAEARLREAIRLDAAVPAFHCTLGNVLQDRGALKEAIVAYRRALRLQPDLAEAHNDLGTAYFSRGEAERAVQSYLRAAELRPDHAVAFANLGAVYRKLGLAGLARRAMQREFVLRASRGVRALWRRLTRSEPSPAEEALLSGQLSLAARIARRAFERDPASASAKALLAAVEHRRGRLEEALVLMREALALKPGDAALRQRFGALAADAQLAARDAAGAERGLREALRARPRDAGLLFRLGEALFRQGRTSEAEAELRRALELDPANAQAWIRLGDLLRMGGRLDEAGHCLERALELDAESPTALLAQGMLLREQGRIASALARFEEVLRLEPRRAQALRQIGGILRYDNKLEEAERRFRDGLAARPDDIALLVDLAMVLGDQMRYEEAFATLEKGLALDPRAALALAAKGLLLDLVGKEAESLELLRAAQRLAPEDSDIGYNLALYHLRHGGFAQGWDGFELRRRKENFIGRYRRLPFPEWQDEDLAGKTVLVYPEQGLGDEIMYSSCIPDLAARARHVAIECDRKLGAIFARSFPGCTVEPRLRTMENDWVNHLEPRPDFQVAMGSLPRRFRRRAEDFPGRRGHLQADPAKVAAWRARLDALGPGAKIGLSWQGGVGHTGRLRRSLTLEQLRPILEPPGKHFVSLQYTDVAAEIAKLEKDHAVRVHHWPDAIDDYDETAALVCALDKVLTVCTAIVHLTGALGRPAIVMVPFGSDWRYGATGGRMMWYPSVRLLRQRAIGDWSEVLADAARFLDTDA